MRAVTDFRPHTTVRLDRVGETGPDVHLYAVTLGGEPKGLDDIIRVHCIPYDDMVHSSSNHFVRRSDSLHGPYSEVSTMLQRFASSAIALRW